MSYDGLFVVPEILFRNLSIHFGSEPEELKPLVETIVNELMEHGYVTNGRENERRLTLE